MARQFSYPEVAALEENQVCFLTADAATLKRKVALYAARHGKRFDIKGDSTGVSVTRLPVTDTELPGVG